MNDIAPTPQSDLRAVIENLVVGTSLDDETLHRIRDRSAKSREELVLKHGVREIAVELLRESRNEATAGE